MGWRMDTDFPGANACGAAADVADGLPAISLTADPRDGNEALWFRFRLWRIAPESPPPVLWLRHVDTLLGGGDGSALQPVIRCDGGRWERLPRGQPVVRSDGCTDARWRLPAAAAMMDVAFCYPYGPEELAALVGRAGLRVRSIGASERGRPLWRLDNGAGAEESSRPGLFIVARHHSGETPGSWVLEGLLEGLAEMGEAAPLVWAIPFADLDGVVEGRYGKDRHPVDFNRSWPGAGRMTQRHETLCYLRDVQRWRKRCRPRLVLDLHAPGASEREGVFCFLSTDAAGKPWPESAAWAERVRAALAEYAASADRFFRMANYPSRWPRQTHSDFTGWACAEGVAALSIETSYQGVGDRVFDLGDYREIGRRIGGAISSGPLATGDSGSDHASGG